MTSAIIPAILGPISSSVPTYLGGFDGANAVSWVRVVDGLVKDVKVGDSATVRDGDLVTVNGYKGVQLDGVTERIELAANAARLSGMTTKGTFDLIVRIDTYATNDVLVGIADDIQVNDDADSFIIRLGTSPKGVGSVRMDSVRKTVADGSLSNGNTYHIRLAFDSTVALLKSRLFIDDMSTHVGEANLTQDTEIENAGTTALTLGALEGGGDNATVTVFEFMARNTYETDQLPGFG